MSRRVVRRALMLAAMVTPGRARPSTVQFLSRRPDVSLSRRETIAMIPKASLGVLALCLATTGAEAASENLLPLERGAYALETTDCPQRSRAEITTFWGDRLNQSSAECALSNVKAQGSVFTFTSRCKVEGERKPLVETRTLRIADKKHFFVVETVGGRPTETAYKWCAYRAFD